MPTEPKIAVRGVSMVYAVSGQPTVALTEVNLEVCAGEFLCLLGPSGCGKTTLLNILAGFVKPTTGSAFVDGVPVVGPDRRRVLVFQENGVFPWLTVEGNIAFPLRRLGTRERAARVAHYIDLVGLRGFERAFPHTLSGGMKQRLEIARALAVNPEVLFLDEPFSAVDAITRVTLRSELLRIWSVERKTIVMVTHDIDESVQLADRIVVMSARPGRVRRVTPVELSRPRNLSSSGYLAIRDSLLHEMGLAHQV